MDKSLKERVAKIVELINRGAMEGEKQVAQKALDRIIARYNITADQLDNVEVSEYRFLYQSVLELWLLERLMFLFVPGGFKTSGRAPWDKSIRSRLKYQDWVTLECAYEYFRRHMKKEWKRTCEPELQKCRKVKTKNRRRKELQTLFFSQYVIASKLHKPEEIRDSIPKSHKEAVDRMMLKGVQGGVYNKQVIGGLFIENTNNTL